MTLFLTILHVLISLFIIAIVLLQSGKGAEVGAAFGGGGASQSVFGASGGGNFMTKVTAAAATIFMLTSLTLAYLSGHAPGSTIMSGKSVPKAAPAAPAQQSAPAVPVQQPAK